MSSQVALDHQAALDELVKQAQSEAAAREVVSQGELSLRGTLRNATTSRSMRFHDEKIWSGEFTRRYPQNLPFNQYTPIEQVSKAENGIKSAVVYSGRVRGVIDCGWLVAWSNPRGSQDKKVYVDCGEISKFNNINWPAIEAELSKSSNSSERVDDSTDTVAIATIVPPQNGSANGLLAVTFGG